MKIKLLTVAAVVSLGVVVSLVNSTPVNAQVPPDLRFGYFTGTYGPSNLSTGTVLTNGLLNKKISSIGGDRDDILDPNNWAFNDLTNKSQFINFIEYTLNNGNQRDRTGAAFIIQIMRGETSPDGGTYANRPPTSSEIQEWKNLINQSNVSLRTERTIIESINSSYMDAKTETETTYTTCSVSPFSNEDKFCRPPTPSGTGWFAAAGSPYRLGSQEWQTKWQRTRSYAQVNDVMFYSAYTDLPALIFRQGNKDRVKIKINCANIIGSVVPFDKVENWQYNLDVYRSATPVQVEPGQEVVIRSNYSNPAGGVFPSGVSGSDHRHRITPRSATDSSNLSAVISYTNTAIGAIGTGGDPKSVLWANFGPILPGTGISNGVRWRVNSNVAPGTRIWFRAIASPENGSSVNTVDSWGGIANGFFRDTYVDVVAPPRWNYEPDVTVPATVRAGDQFTISSVVDNTDSGTGEAYTHRIESRAGENYLTMNDGGENPDAASKDARWYGRPGIPGYSSSPARSGTWTVSSTAPDNETICFRGSTSPSEGERTTIIVDYRAGPDRCFTVNNERFAMTANVARPTGTTAVVVPGDTARFQVTVYNQGDITARGNTPDVYPNASPGAAVNINCSFSTASSTTAVVSVNGSPGCYASPDWGAAAFDDEVTVDVPANAQLGDKVCLTVSGTALNGFSDGTDPQESFKDEYCYVIGVSPYLQVNNGDIWAGANFDDNNPPLFPLPATCGGEKNNNVKIESVIAESINPNLSTLWKGSFVEYAAFATGKIVSFGSNNAPNKNTLTFANTENPLGEFTDKPRCIANYYELLIAHDYDNADTSTNTSGNINSFGKNRQSLIDLEGTGVFKTTGEWKDISGNRTIVINGDLLINNDITLATDYGDASNLSVPSLVFVVKGDILIDQSVETVDAVLISHGTVRTCTNGTTIITALAKGICAKQLTINGALIANQIDFMRTNEDNSRTGSVDNRNSTPAEIINFTPEFYLSKPIFKSDLISEDAYRTAIIKDLPPIY